MKYSLYLLFAITVLFGSIACKDTQADAAADEFVIHGKYENSAVSQIVLESISPKGYFALDTAMTDEEGNFYFRQKISAVGVYRIKNQMNSFLMLILSPGETVILTADAGNVEQTYELGGSEESERILEFEEYKRTAFLRLDSLRQIWEIEKYEDNSDSTETVLDSMANIIFLDTRKSFESFLEENRGSMACLFAVFQRFADTEIFDRTNDIEWYELVASGLEEKLPGNLHTVDFRIRVDFMRSRIPRIDTDSIAVDSASGE